MSESITERQHTVNLAQEARTSTADALSHFSFEVLRLANLLAEVGETLAQPSRQSSARWQILAAIEEQPQTVAQIARSLGLARQSVQRVADLLAREQLVSYQHNPAHRRARLLGLTATGRIALQDIQTRQSRWANGMSLSFDEQELRQVTAFIQRVQRSLSESGEGDEH